MDLKKKIKKLKKGNIVLVKWDDACSSARWWRDSEAKYWAKHGAPCMSTGFFFSINKVYLTLYMNKSPEEIGQLINIPLSLITKIKQWK